MTSGIKSGSLEHRGIHDDGDEPGDEGSGELASREKSRPVLLSIWAIPAKIAAAGAKSLASVAAPLHPPGFLELRPNNSCMLLFCSAALQLRRADSTGSVIRILEEQAWNGAKSTIF